MEKQAGQRTLVRLLSDYGMLLVLLLLCLFFSAMTYQQHYPTGATAGRQLARIIGQRFGETPRVLIAVRDHADDLELARTLEQSLQGSGAKVVAVVRGTPRDARAALVELDEQGESLDVVAGTKATGGWLVFADLPTSFPDLGSPVVVIPESYGWPNFLKRDNLLNVANQIAVIAIVAVGMTMVIITGGIDLSVGSLIAFSAVLAALLIRDYGGGREAGAAMMWLCSLAAISACGVIGLFSGVMVTWFRIPPFIVTLGMMLVASGLAYILAEGESVANIPDSFDWLGRGADLFGIPNAVVLMLLLYAAAHFLMAQTILGRYIYAVGGNREAARLSGVPVRGVLWFVYLSSGLLAGVGGIVLASLLRSGAPTYGNMYELYVIAAVVVGGTSLAGGEGKILGTLIGAFIIAVINNGMNLTGVESYTQKVVLGLAILGAVVLDRLKHGWWGDAAD